MLLHLSSTDPELGVEYSVPAAAAAHHSWLIGLLLLFFLILAVFLLQEDGHVLKLLLAAPRQKSGGSSLEGESGYVIVEQTLQEGNLVSGTPLYSLQLLHLLTVQEQSL